MKRSTGALAAGIALAPPPFSTAAGPGPLTVRLLVRVSPGPAT